MSLFEKPMRSATAFNPAPRIATASVRFALGFFALGLLGSIAHAQSTAAPVQPGYVDTIGCPSGYTACWHPYTSSNPLPVTDSAPSGTQDTNLKQVNGTTVNVGIGTAGTGTQRVAVSSDSFPATQPVSGTVAATQSGTWTVQPGNTANTTAWKVDGSAVTQPVGGVAASGASVSGNPVGNGCRAATTDPTAVTDGQAVFMMCGASGKQVTLPYAVKELAVRGTASGTDNAAHSIIASAGGSLKNYITALQCGNTSATTTIVTMSDSASSVFIVPANGGTNLVFPVPLATAAATAFSFTAATGVTTMYCSAQGFTGL